MNEGMDSTLDRYEGEGKELSTSGSNVCEKKGALASSLRSIKLNFNDKDKDCKNLDQFYQSS